MNNANYRYFETRHPFTNDVMWQIDDISLALGGIFSLTQQFIKQYPHTDYSLSIYDNISAQTIEIECDIEEIPKIVDYIYHLEKGTPLTFIGINSFSESYVVGMSICRGNIEFGFYKAENGKLKKI